MRHGPQSTLSYKTAGRLVLRSALFWVVLFFSLSCGSEGQEAPKVRAGSIDLSQWDFERDGSVTLAGDWHFWWEALHPPEGFVGGRLPLEGELAPVPKSWAHYEGGEGEPGRKPVAGYATYALSLKLPSARESSLTILEPDLRDSGRIFLVNQEWLMSSDESGKVGTSYDSYIPLRSRMSVEIGAGDGTEVVLVVQVASFVGGLAEGFTSPPVIHTKSSARRYLGRKTRRTFGFRVFFSLWDCTIWLSTFFAARRRLIYGLLWCF